MLGVAGLWRGAGCDLLCRLCWGMKGENVFQSYWESALSHTRCGYNPRDWWRESQGFHLTGLQVS